MLNTMFMDIGAIRRTIVPDDRPENKQARPESEQARPDSVKIYAVQDGYEGNL